MEEDPHEADSQIVSEESSEESKEGTVEDILQVNLYDYISKVIEDRVWCFSPSWCVAWYKEDQAR